MTPDYDDMESPEVLARASRRRQIGFGAVVVGLLLIAGAVYFTGGSDEQGGPPEASVAPLDPEPAPAAEVAGTAGPSFDVVRISRGGTGVIAGRATPGAQVDILKDEEVIGTVRADANGEWVLILEEPLEPGPAELSLVARLGDDSPAQSSDIVVVSVPESDPQEVFVPSQTDGVVAVLTPRDGDGPSRVLQKPGIAAPAEVGDSLSLDTLDYTPDGTAVLAGRSLPRATVRVYLDNQFAGEARASDDGRWLLETSEPLTAGEHEARIDQVVGEGEVQLRIEQPFVTGDPLNTELAQSRVIVQPGNTLWQIARRLYGSGVRYTLIFRENSEQIRDPDLIYPGQLFELPRGGADEAGAEDATN